jgi:hypothetical protein
MVLLQWRLCAFSFVIAFALANWAMPPSAGAAPNNAATMELMRVFDDICLKKFPDDTKIAAYAEARHFSPLSPEIISKMLGKDPAVGWTQKGGFGDYVITIERPPFHTCAVRKQFLEMPDIHESFATTLEVWRASLAGAKITERPMQSPAIGGIVAQLYAFAMSAPGAQNEALLAIITPHDGIAEVRLVRGLGNL